MLYIQMVLYMYIGNKNKNNNNKITREIEECGLPNEYHTTKI